jgi:histone H3/H4
MAAQETLVVASKVKAYIKGKGLNTSASAIDALSNRVREICDAAVQNATSDRRKTVKDRDIES